ncbi:immunoglobulin I-set domain protein, partial [Oesophagostomum dentatum]
KSIGTKVICDREGETADIEAVLNSSALSQANFSLATSGERPAVEKAAESYEESESYDEAPHFTQTLEDGHFDGDQCNLKCILTATPPAKVEWTVNDVAVKEDEDHHLIDEDGILIAQIRNITSEVLRVTCTAVNEHGTAVTRCQVTKRIVEKPAAGRAPSFIVPLKNIESDADEVHLKCVVSGEPLPKITWFLNGEELKEE